MSIVREELLSQKKQVHEKNDPTLQPYEGYKVDYDYFKLLFAAFSPWGKGEMAESVSARIFRVSKQIKCILVVVQYSFINFCFFFHQFIN